ncbi:uncharacterized protein UHO2_01849 [Ustilago hordei]|uniref:uncharacterized protein n=1 Tax=Ustilago hordei TaxID=120017 RepID=UPI001A48524A|nr:uncharacterized protein UHO2_01849 [Ustilago hordei]SYW85605.1 related to Gag-pol polyprotein [Ustilago hordei]
MTVEFLGYIIKPTGVEMDPEKPLTSLVKLTECFKKFELPEEAQQAFHKLIQAFTTARVLQHFNYHLPTRLETDASNFAITGVLKQEHEGCWHPVAFYSRKILSAEKNYKIHNKELLAVVACLTQWRHMLAGLPSQLVILTDHEALKYFKLQHCITGRQARWVVLLADFNFVLQYQPGDKGGEPDALTRRADMQPVSEEQEHNVRQLLPPQVFEQVENEITTGNKLQQISAENVIASMILPISVESVLTACSGDDSVLVAPILTMESIATKGIKDLARIFQPLDPELQGIHLRKPFEIRDSLWYSGGRLVIPKNTCDSWSCLNVMMVSQLDMWGKMLPLSQPNDTIGGQTCQPGLLIMSQVAKPWGSISLDFIEGLPPSKGYDSILVIVDRLTKFAILAPTYKMVTAKQTAVLLWHYLVQHFGYPDHMVLDRGRQFISGAWKAFADQMGMKHSLSTAYHPQTHGQMERVNQVVEQYLRMYCNYEQNDWAGLLDTAAFVYNNTIHNSIGVSPFFACYGWNPKAHPDIPQHLGVNNPKRSEYLLDGKEHCKYLQGQIREAQRHTVNHYNRRHKDIEFKVGDMVYINHKNWKTR